MAESTTQPQSPRYRWGYWPLIALAILILLFAMVKDYTGLWTGRSDSQTPMTSDMAYRQSRNSQFPTVQVGDDAWALCSTLRQTPGVMCDRVEHPPHTNLHTWHWRISRKNQPDDVLIYTALAQDLTEDGTGVAPLGTARHTVTEVHKQQP